MSLLASIVLGLIAGFIGSKLVNKSGAGVALGVVLGIVGAVIEVWVFLWTVPNVLHGKACIITSKTHKSGIMVHKYGPHIFHTNSKDVFNYLSQFTQWRSYEHRVRASVDGKLVPIPINLDTVNQLYGLDLKAQDLEAYFDSVAEKRENLHTAEDVVVSRVGRDLYERMFRGYTRKQWGLDPSDLDASVTARIPFRTNRDDRYFADTYQAMPLHGFTRMFENMLDHPKITIILNTPYRDVLRTVRYRELVYTGPVDEFFEFRFGRLPYRSLKFQHEPLETPQVQPVGVTNYPNEHSYIIRESPNSNT